MGRLLEEDIADQLAILVHKALSAMLGRLDTLGQQVQFLDMLDQLAILGHRELSAMLDQQVLDMSVVLELDMLDLEDLLDTLVRLDIPGHKELDLLVVVDMLDQQAQLRAIQDQLVIQDQLALAILDQLARFQGM